ncbi:MAG: nucleoid occlusion protein, partial [Alicyclobacillus sp.]|nr:nucleoid occlusion protein [Alicyclobacillus sp.]
LLNLPRRVQDALLSRTITERHARALLALPNEELQIQLLEECIERGWNVKQMEERVKVVLERLQATPRRKPRKKGLSRDVRLAVNTIRESLQMIEKSGLAISCEEHDETEYVEFVIRVPKRSGGAERKVQG